MQKDYSLGPCSPLFIVSDIQNSLIYYVDKLGFDCRFSSTDIPATFAIVGCNSAQIMLKSISEKIPPLPNRKRHAWVRWDAFVYVDNPLKFESDLDKRGTLQGKTTHITDEGLNGFELEDPDGYVCFFGHPV